MERRLRLRHNFSSSVKKMLGGMQSCANLILKKNDKAELEVSSEYKKHPEENTADANGFV